MKRFKAIGFLTILISLFLTINVFSQIKDGETVLAAKQTLPGKLQLVKIVSEDKAAAVYIKLNNKIIKELNYESAYIEQSYPQISPKFFLIGLSTESLVCAVKFVILDLSKGLPKVTDEFGNCGDAPKITYRNQSLTLNFPPGERESKYTIGKKQIWIYRSGKLKNLK
jgi:hypothetical protein